jgi:hypothetical protein
MFPSEISRAVLSTCRSNHLWLIVQKSIELSCSQQQNLVFDNPFLVLKLKARGFDDSRSLCCNCLRGNDRRLVGDGTRGAQLWVLVSFHAVIDLNTESLNKMAP